MGSAYLINGNNIDRILQSIEPIGCILNSEGIILDVSAGWKEAADENGLQLHNYAIGTNYLRHCIDRDATSLDTYRGLTRVLSGQAPFFGTVYPCHAAGHAPRWFFMAAFGFASTADRTMVLHLNVSHALNVGLAGDHEPTEPYDVLLRTVRRAIREELAHFSPAPSAPPVDHADRKRLAKLTSRQLQLLHLLAKGYSNAQIAEQLGIALSSAKSQTAMLLRALNCANRTQAALFGARLGFDQGPPTSDYVL